MPLHSTLVTIHSNSGFNPWWHHVPPLILSLLIIMPAANAFVFYVWCFWSVGDLTRVWCTDLFFTPYNNWGGLSGKGRLISTKSPSSELYICRYAIFLHVIEGGVTVVLHANDPSTSKEKELPIILVAFTQFPPPPPHPH